MKTKAKTFSASAWISLADRCGMDPTVIIYLHGERMFQIDVANIDEALSAEAERPLNSDERTAVCNELVKRSRFYKATIPHPKRQRATKKWVVCVTA
jgi:hypothetical protein